MTYQTKLRLFHVNFHKNSRRLVTSVYILKVLKTLNVNAGRLSPSPPTKRHHCLLYRTWLIITQRFWNEKINDEFEILQMTIIIKTSQIRNHQSNQHYLNKLRF